MNLTPRCRILHLDIRDGLEPPCWGSGDAPCYLVLWWADLPLGGLLLQPGGRPHSGGGFRDRVLSAVTPALLSRLADKGNPVGRRAKGKPLPGHLSWEALLSPLGPLVSMEEAQGGGEAPGLTLSVVLCTRDRPQQIARALASFKTLAQGPQEILVVDNAPSTRETRGIVAGHPGVRYVEEPNSGLDNARNAGIAESTGEIVAYVDDDVTLHPSWALRIRRAFGEREVAAVTGLVLPASLATEAQFLFETVWGLGKGFQRRRFGPRFFREEQAHGVPVWEIGAGANMAFRRGVLLALGGFDPRLDVGAAGCSGDSEIWYRLLASGGVIQYEPAAVVFHSHREDMAGLRGQIFHYMRGHTAALCVQFEKTGDWGNLRRLFLSLPLYYARLLTSQGLSEKAGRRPLLLEEIKGSLAGIGYYLMHAKKTSKATAPE